MTYTVKIGRKTATVDTLSAASALFCAARDKSGRGASGWPNGLVFSAGEQIAYISYNGRVWGGASYQPDATPLCEAQS